MSTEIKDVKRVQAIEADIPSTIRAGQDGYSSDTFKLFHLYNDGSTLKTWSSDTAVKEYEKIIFNLGDSVDNFAYITTDSTGNEFEFQSGYHSVNTPKNQKFTIVAAATEATSFSLFENQDSDELLKIYSNGVIEMHENDVDITNNLLITAGNIGIGSTQPTTKLDIFSADNTLAKFKSSDDLAMIQIIDNDSFTYVGTKDSFSFIGSTASLSPLNLNINTSGQVGIGTTVLLPTAPLYVYTDSNIFGIYLGNATNKLSLAGTAGGSEEYSLIQSDTNRPLIFQRDGGNVGIGSTIPTEKLDIIGDCRVSVDLHVDGSIIAGDYETNIANVQELQIDSIVGLDYLGTQLRINKDGGYSDTSIQGNVGIGTTTITDSLHIEKATGVTNRILISNDGSKPVVYLGGADTTGAALQLYNESQSETIRLYAKNNEPSFIDNGGKVGIGTTNPGTLLHIHTADADNALFISTHGATRDLSVIFGDDLDGTPTYFSMGYDQSQDSFNISESNSLATNQRITINNFGYVGIGSTDPQEKLHVGYGNLSVSNGHAYISNTLLVGDLSNRLATNLAGSIAAVGGTRDVTLRFPNSLAQVCDLRVTLTGYFDAAYTGQGTTIIYQGPISFQSNSFNYNETAIQSAIGTLSANIAINLIAVGSSDRLTIRITNNHGTQIFSGYVCIDMINSQGRVTLYSLA